MYAHGRASNSIQNFGGLRVTARMYLPLLLLEESLIFLEANNKLVRLIRSSENISIGQTGRFSADFSFRGLKNSLR